MDENNHKQLMLTLLRDWAAAKGDPDAPFGFVDGRVVSANDYVAMIERDPDALYAFMETMAKEAKVPVDQYMREKIAPGP